MYKSLPWNVGGHRVQLHLAKAGTMSSYFHIYLIRLHHDQTGPVSDDGHQTVPGLTKAFFEGCGVKILPSNGHKSPSIDVQRVDIL